MTKTVTPQPGDVWEGADGERRFIVKRVGENCWRDTIDGWDFVRCHQHWFATAKRVFPPVHAPQGETITVECVVMVDRYRDIVVKGESGRAISNVVQFMDDDYRHAATVAVHIPKSLLSPSVLPAVVVE